MKYIDAEKLIAKIWEICDYASEHWDVEKERGAYEFASKLTDFITSLQQEQPKVDLGESVEFECIGKKVKMTIQELINYYIDTECCDVADECGF